MSHCWYIATFTGGVAAKSDRNCLTLSRTHTDMLWNQLKGTEAMFPFSGAVISPDSRPLCPRAKWSVRFIKQNVPDAVPRCVFAASWQGSALDLVHASFGSLVMTSIQYKSKELFIQCCNCRKCWRCIYISSRASVRAKALHTIICMGEDVKTCIHAYLASDTQARVDWAMQGRHHLHAHISSSLSCYVHVPAQSHACGQELERSSS